MMGYIILGSALPMSEERATDTCDDVRSTMLLSRAYICI